MFLQSFFTFEAKTVRFNNLEITEAFDDDEILSYVFR